MEEGFLFDGIDVCRADAGMDQRVVGATAVFADAAVAAFAIINDTFAGTELAAGFLEGEFFVELRFDDEARILGGRGASGPSKCGPACGAGANAGGETRKGGEFDECSAVAFG
jgi:hypothetical protein